jgi:two-component system sensor histidine kinase/response regulator
VRRRTSNEPGNMRRLQQARILRKITVATILTSGIALLLAGSAFVANDFVQLRRNLQRELFTSADIVAAGSATALSLRDGDAAIRALGILRADQRIAAAALYPTESRQPVATYYRNGSPAPPLPTVGHPGVYTEDRFILVIRSVVREGGVIGTLAIRADAGDLSSVLTRDLRMAVLVILTCILSALLFTSHIRRMIAQPIISLTDAAGKLAADNLYRLRYPAKATMK